MGTLQYLTEEDVDAGAVSRPLQNQPQEPVTLPDGESWLIVTELTRGQRRQLRRANSIGAARLVRENQELMALATEELKAQAQAAAVGIVTDPWTEEEEDTMLLVGTVSWSFKVDINPETISTRLERYSRPVLARMKELYLEPRESTQAASKKV